LKVLNFRHIGIVVPDEELEEIAESYSYMGFDFDSRGHDIIDGQVIQWIKLKNKQGFMVELLNGGFNHLAFTVDRVNEDRYIRMAPSGHRIQFEVRGMPIEFVEEPKQEG
jgi:hypothetical protein